MKCQMLLKIIRYILQNTLCMQVMHIYLDRNHNCWKQLMLKYFFFKFHVVTTNTFNPSQNYTLIWVIFNEETDNWNHVFVENM